MRLIDANALLEKIRGVPQVIDFLSAQNVYELIEKAPTQDFNELLEHCAHLCENHWDVDSAAADIRKLKQNG